VATTFGQVTVYTVILCHVLCHSAAIDLFTAHGWGMENKKEYAKGFLQCRSRFTTSYKARIWCRVRVAAVTCCLISAALSLNPASAVGNVS
jgi:hypothetical protein